MANNKIDHIYYHVCVFWFQLHMYHIPYAFSSLKNQGSRSAVSPLAVMGCSQLLWTGNCIQWNRNDDIVSLFILLSTSPNWLWVHGELLWTPFPVCGREHRPEVRESHRDADWWGSCVYCRKDIFRWTWNTLESLRFETRTDKWMLALLNWIQTVIPRLSKMLTSLVKRNCKRNSDH